MLEVVGACFGCFSVASGFFTGFLVYLADAGIEVHAGDLEAYDLGVGRGRGGVGEEDQVGLVQESESPDLDSELDGEIKEERELPLV